MPAYHIDQSIEINAPADRVYEIVADFGTWTTWSPWLCAEPDADVQVTGEAATLGSIYRWNGEVVGAGELEHVELVPGKSIIDEIRFFRPFKSVSQVSFEIEPTSSDTTRITWNMDGKLPWFLFWMKSTMVSMIGMDYERGLKMLKELMETGSVASKTEVLGTEQVGPMHVAGIRKKCSMDTINEAMDAAFGEAKERVGAAGMCCEGEMASVYHEVDMKAKTFDFTAGYVVPELKDAEGISTWSLPACDALSVKHTGSYDHLGNAWSAAYQHLRYKKLKLSQAGTFEVYRNDPGTTPTEALLTDVYLPLR